MLRRAGPHLSYANVMATVAVFVALGGTSYAAVQISGSDIRNNTIQSKDVKNDAIRTQDIKENTIKGIDVRNGSLLARDFAPGQLPAGPTGPAGPQGPAGKDGTAGTGGTGGAGRDTTLFLGSTRAFSFNPGLPVYCVPSGPTIDSCNTSLSDSAQGMSSAGTTVVARDLTIAGSSPGAGQTATFTLLDDGADTPVSCVISGTETSCNSGAGTATIAPESKLSLKLEQSSDAVGANPYSFGWRAVTE